MAFRDAAVTSEMGLASPEGPVTHLPMVLGVVHDFNSSLTLVLGHLALLEEGPLLNHQPELIRNLRQAVEHAAALPRHLLELARGAAPNTRRVDVRALVLDLEGLLRGR